MKPTDQPAAAAGAAPNGSPDSFVRDGQREQWWLAELDRYDNVRHLIDGAHNDASGAHEAYDLRKRLGLLKASEKYAVVRCEVFAPAAVAARAQANGSAG